MNGTEQEEERMLSICFAGGAVRFIQPQVRHTAGEVADEGAVLHGGHSRYFNAAFFLELSVTLFFATAFSKSQKLYFKVSEI